MQAPEMPKPKKPPKPDPAARRLKALDYVGMLLGVEPPEPQQPLPPPIGFRFPDQPQEPMLPAPMYVPQPRAPRMLASGSVAPAPNADYMNHVVRMRGRMGW